MSNPSRSTHRRSLRKLKPFNPGNIGKSNSLVTFYVSPDGKALAIAEVELVRAKIALLISRKPKFNS